jgi:hypothetical protein
LMACKIVTYVDSKNNSVEVGFHYHPDVCLLAIAVLNVNILRFLEPLSLLDCITLSWLPILRFSSEIPFSGKTVRGARITGGQVTACAATSCVHLHLGTCRQMMCVLGFLKLNNITTKQPAPRLPTLGLHTGWFVFVPTADCFVLLSVFNQECCPSFVLRRNGPNSPLKKK